jgi:hypothetical protein
MEQTYVDTVKDYKNRDKYRLSFKEYKMQDLSSLGLSMRQASIKDQIMKKNQHLQVTV